MNTPPRLSYTSIRTRIVDGQVLIGLKHTATAAADMPIKTPWIEMTPEDAAGLVGTIQKALDELGGGDGAAQG
jgi:hypothetical protein